MKCPHYNTKNHTPWAGDPNPSRDPYSLNMHSRKGGFRVGTRYVRTNGERGLLNVTLEVLMTVAQNA